MRLKPEPSGEWEPRWAAWPDLARAFEVRQTLRKLSRHLSRHYAKAVHEREGRRC